MTPILYFVDFEHAACRRGDRSSQAELRPVIRIALSDPAAKFVSMDISERSQTRQSVNIHLYINRPRGSRWHRSEPSESGQIPRHWQSES
jgi:hypothetical protein